MWCTNPSSESLSIYICNSGKYFNVNSYRLAVDSANEADVPHIIFHLSLLISEAGKGIDNDTEDDVEEQDDDDQEERQIVECAQIVDFFGFVKVGIGGQGITNTTTSSQTEVQS